MLNCPLFCDQFVHILDLRLHLRVHANNGTLDFPIICSLCRESLSTVSIYISHLRTVHAADVHEATSKTLTLTKLIWGGGYMRRKR